MEKLIIIGIVIMIIGLILTLKNIFSQKRNKPINPIYIPENGLDKYIFFLRSIFDQFANEEDLRRYIILNSKNLMQYDDYEEKIEALIEEFINYKYQDN